MKILIDMNLSPQWVQEFNKFGFEAVHWSTIGKFDAEDNELMEWARTNDHIIFTHDLDFGTSLALTKAIKPSVIQVRTQNVTVAYLGKMVLHAIIEHKIYLEQGALIILDELKQRIKILPF